MKLRTLLFFIFFFTEARAHVINIAEEETKGPPTPSRFEGAGGIKKNQSSAPIVADAPPPPVQEEDEKTSVFLVSGEVFTIPGSNAPGSNTSGGGVPRLGDEFLNLFPAPEMSWWERWWQAIINFFS